MSPARSHATASASPLPLDSPRAGGEAAVVGRRLEYQALGLAMVLAAIVYGFYLEQSSFPLNDGGLFYAMIRDIQHAHYALPRVTSYDPRIPFVYPPLPLYIAAALAGATHIDLLTVLRLLPPAVTLATIPAFFLLARRLLRSDYAVAVAVLAFALVPGTFMWRIMGGGITRSFGLLFALLAIYYLLRQLETSSRWAVLATGVFAGLTLLSHPEASGFLALSAVLVLAWYGRSKRALAGAVVAGLVALVVSSPWWLTVLHRFGLGPFVAVLHGGSGNIVHGLTVFVLAWRIGLETLFPLMGVLGLLGMVSLCAQRRLLLPVWLAAECVVVDPRAGDQFAVVPLSLAAGIGVAEVLVPALARLTARNRAASEPGVLRPASRVAEHRWSRPAVTLLGLALICAMFNAIAQQDPLGTLSPADRVAIQWAAEHTPASSSFLIIPGDTSRQISTTAWTKDRVAEWFPALAGRHSAITPQGQEWVGDFDQTVKQYEALQICTKRDTGCLESWASQTGRSFDYVYLPKAASADGAQCCWALSQSLASDSSYVPVYDGPGATIYAHRSATGPQMNSPKRSSAPKVRAARVR